MRNGFLEEKQKLHVLKTKLRRERSKFLTTTFQFLEVDNFKHQYSWWCHKASGAVKYQILE